MGWLLAAAGCRCSQTWLLLINVLYSRHVLYVFHAKQKIFLLLFFSRPCMQLSMSVQYSLIRASEW
jgi:hypothetical protein